MRSTRSAPKGRLWASRALGILAAGCFALALALWQGSQSRQEALAALSPRSPLMDTAATQAPESAQPLSSQAQVPSPKAEPTPTLEDWQEAQSAFEGLASWVDVAGTEVSSPVMQASESAPDWYLDHDAQGAYDASGIPYLDWRTSASSAVRVVYGHNLGWGTQGRFGSLANRWQPEAFSELGWAAWAVPGQPTRAFAPLCALSVSMNTTNVLGLGLGEKDVSSWLTELLSHLDTKDPSASSFEGVKAAYAQELASQATNALVLVTCTGDALPSQQRTVVVFVEPPL